MCVAATLTASTVCAEESSLWQKFVDFFSPTSEVKGDGPLYDELRELDRKINRVEGKYARERRPLTKDRYKKELKNLYAERESLLKKIEAEKGKTVGVSSSLAQSSAAVSSSSVIASSSSSVPVAEKPVVACRPDTIYVRDTIVVHDTLYVMLAPKPEPAPESDPDSSR